MGARAPNSRSGTTSTVDREAASDVLRSLVSEIVLTPSAGELLVDLRGDLAGILAVASSDKQKPGFLSEAGPELLSQVMMVAGTRNQRFLRLVEQRIPKLAA